MEQRTHTRQLIASLAVAVLLVVVVIAVVTARFGPTSTARLDRQEEIQKERTDRIEERQKQQEDARKDAEDGE